MQRLRRGIVKWFSLTRYYGFVHCQDGDIFLHGNEWMNPNRPPQKDELIQFEVEEDREGRLMAVKADRVN